MKKADSTAHTRTYSADGQQQVSALIEKTPSLEEEDNRSCVDTAPGVSSALCATDDLTEISQLHVSDAEASSRIVVRRWDAIGEQGVFVGATAIASGEVLGVLQGIIVRRRRLTPSERRQLIGIRVDGRAAHIDVQGRWPERINHAPPSRCNVVWDPDTWQIMAIRDIQPNEQLFFDYGVGYWVDELINKDYDKLPKDQKAFFDAMHVVVDNYAWLSQAFRQRKLSQAMRVGIIAFYLSQQCLGSYSADSLSVFDDASSRAIVAIQDTNPLVQYLLDQGMNVQSGGSENESNKRKLSDETSSPGCPAALDLVPSVVELMSLNL